VRRPNASWTLINLAAADNDSPPETTPGAEGSLDPKMNAVPAGLPALTFLDSHVTVNENSSK